MIAGPAWSQSAKKQSQSHVPKLIVFPEKHHEPIAADLRKLADKLARENKLCVLFEDRWQIRDHQTIAMYGRMNMSIEFGADHQSPHPNVLGMDNPISWMLALISMTRTLTLPEIYDTQPIDLRSLQNQLVLAWKNHPFFRFYYQNMTRKFPLYQKDVKKMESFFNQMKATQLFQFTSDFLETMIEDFTKDEVLFTLPHFGYFNLDRFLFTSLEGAQEIKNRHTLSLRSLEMAEEIIHQYRYNSTCRKLGNILVFMGKAHWEGKYIKGFPTGSIRDHFYSQKIDFRTLDIETVAIKIKQINLNDPQLKQKQIQVMTEP